MYTGEGSTDKIRRDKREGKIVAYAEDYFQITPSDENKGIRELHQDFKKQNHIAKKILIRIRSACLSLST